MKDILSMRLNGFNVIEVKEFNSAWVQARTHKSKRINKKWLKRYGKKVISQRVKGYDPDKAFFFGGNYFIPTKLLNHMKKEGLIS